MNTELLRVVGGLESKAVFNAATLRKKPHSPQAVPMTAHRGRGAPALCVHLVVVNPLDCMLAKVQFVSFRGFHKSIEVAPAVKIEAALELLNTQSKAGGMFQGFIQNRRATHRMIENR